MFPQAGQVEVLKDGALLQWYTGLASTLYHAQKQLATAGDAQTDAAASSLDTTVIHNKNEELLEGSHASPDTTTAPTGASQHTEAKPQTPSECGRDTHD